MRLNRQSEIAVGILAACARSEGNLRTIHDLARVTGTTPDHAAQITAILGREGYLVGTRGRGGGLSLSRSANSIRLVDVLCSMQPELANSSSTRDTEICPFGARFSSIIDAATSQFLSSMENVTIADLVREERAVSGSAHQHGVEAVRCP